MVLCYGLGMLRSGGLSANTAAARLRVADTIDRELLGAFGQMVNKGE